MDEGPENDFNAPENDDEGRRNFCYIAISVFIHLVFAWQMKFTVSDNCINSLLYIVKYLLTMMQFVFGMTEFCNMVEVFPETMHKARHFLDFQKDEFVKFVVCPKCHKLYTYDQAQIIVHGKKQSKLCDFVQYPNHPHVRMRSPCGATLMKVIVNKDGNNQSLYPYKTYCYQSLKISLQRLLQRQDVRKALARNIVQNEGAYFDIYDGRVWKQFKDPNGQQYFKDRRNLAGMFNIDWFQPFEGSEHSLGAMYLVLLNLPREMRFKKENILLVGLIPGPHEPELNVNTYLTPFVTELLQFWKGVRLYEDNDLTLYRFVLLCISSDPPATRKCCGFLSYNAKKGIFFSFKSKFLNLHKTLKNNLYTWVFCIIYASKEESFSG